MKALLMLLLFGLVFYIYFQYLHKIVSGKGDQPEPTNTTYKVLHELNAAAADSFRPNEPKVWGKETADLILRSFSELRRKNVANRPSVFVAFGFDHTLRAYWSRNNAGFDKHIGLVFRCPVCVDHFLLCIMMMVHDRCGQIDRRRKTVAVVVLLVFQH